MVSLMKDMLGAESVGIYAVAVRVSEAWYFIPLVIANTFYPTLTRARAANRDLYNDRFVLLYALLAWISIAAALPVSIWSGKLIELLFGGQYAAAAGPLSIHIWAGVFVALGMASGKWLVLEGLQRYAAVRTFAGALFNVILNLVLIPKMGAAGAAWATLISYAASSYLAHLLHPRLWPAFRMETAALCMGWLRLAHWILNRSAGRREHE